MDLPKQYTAWLDAMLTVSRHYGIGASAENARVALAWESGTPLDSLLEIMARQMGLSIRLSGFDASTLRCSTHGACRSPSNSPMAVWA